MLRHDTARRITELHISEAGGPPQVVVLREGKMRIGRELNNEIRVSDRFVSSGSHCAFIRDADGVWLVDFGHPNGQEVNGARQVDRRQLLTAGDVVRIGGDVVIRCVDAAATDEPGRG